MKVFVFPLYSEVYHLLIKVVTYSNYYIVLVHLQNSAIRSGQFIGI